MKDVLIPIGLLLFIVLFAYAIVYSARKQRAAKEKVFKEFASKQGFSYLSEDDGQVQEFAQEFDGIGQFRSSSRGDVIPKDVVSGAVNSSTVMLFRHNIRYSEGGAREWFVAGLTGTDHIADRCSVQFCKGRSDKTTMYLQDGIVKEQTFGSFNMVVRAESTTHAGKLLDDHVLQQLAALARELSFRPEIQARGKRVIAYLADGNATVDDVSTLGELLEFATKTAGI